MIDRTSRDRTCKILKSLALGKVTNYECENQFLDLPKDDPAVYALFRTVNEIGGDREESLRSVFKRGSEMRKRLCRWIFFLKTDLEYQWPQEREAPGIRDFYKPNWFDKTFGLPSRSADTEFCSRGDYNVWPFLREEDFKAARLACAERRRATA